MLIKILIPEEISSGIFFSFVLGSEIATFYDFSEPNPTAFQYTFDGGTPASSAAARQITYTSYSLVQL